MTITLASGFPVGSSGSGTPNPVTFSATIANTGDLIVVVFVGGVNTGIHVTSVTDSNSRVTWQSTATVVDFDANAPNQQNELWWGVTASTGTTTINVNLSGAEGAYVIANAIEVHDSNAGNKWSVVTSGSNNGTTGTTVQLPSLTSGTATDQTYIGYASVAGTATSPSSGFTLWQDAFTAGILYNLGLSASTLYNPTCTDSISGYFDCVAAIFQSTPSVFGAGTFVGEGSTPHALVGLGSSPTVTQGVKRAGYF